MISRPEETLVAVHDLKKSHRVGQVVTPVLRSISFELQRGSFTAIVGPSGCGKTTLLNVLGALDRADSGAVTVCGINLTSASSARISEYRRHSVGFVFQFFNLLPSLTALENVEASLEFLGLSAKDRRRRAIDYLERVGLSDQGPKFPAQLSGGQQQRVAVARALSREPALLLADEPTGNLDQESGERVFECIRELQHTLGVTCLMVTHDIDLARRVERVINMRDGSITHESSGALRSERVAAPKIAGASR
jgi:putative ABC transport system ATP-binding protein